MPIHLQREINRLEAQIGELSAAVLANLRRAVRAVRTHDGAVARQVVEADEDIDRREVLVEEECLKILALHQPVAVDLRYITTVFKVNRDLERIGDLAVSIAEYALKLTEAPPHGEPFDFDFLPEEVQFMVERCVNALTAVDGAAARDIWRADDRIDELCGALEHDLLGRIDRQPSQWKYWTCCLGVARCLERIADHAANIAKDIIYLAEGVIARHRGKEFK